MLIGIDTDTCEPQRYHACLMMGPWPDVRGLCGANTIWAASEEGQDWTAGPGGARAKIDCARCLELMADIGRSPIAEDAP